MRHNPQQALKQALEQLRVDLAEADPASINTRLLQAQQLFQQQVLDSESLTPELAARVRACQTEMNKQFRLLGADLAFLQAARQPDTLHQRRNQICNRLSTLIDYCNALLKLLEG